MLLQVSAAFALVLRSFGLLINSVGGETQLDLATYTFAGQGRCGGGCIANTSVFSAISLALCM